MHVPNRPGTKSKPLWYHSYLLIPRPKPDTKLAHAYILPSFPFFVPHSRENEIKTATDLKLCLNVKDSWERHKEKRMPVQKVRIVTPGSRWTLKDVWWFLPLLTKKYHLLSSAAYSSLDAGVQLVCQISNINIYLKGLTKLHLSPACSLNMTEKDRQRD